MMTDKHLYPKSGPRSSVSRAEVKVYAALAKALPLGWRAWHSLKVRTKGKWEGEGDFVIAIPDKGILVLEVKGGSIELKDGRWYQNSRALEKAPRDQAQSFVRNLVKAIEERGASRPPYGIACVFPDCDFSEARCGDLDGLVIGERQLRYLQEALPSLAERAIPSYKLPRDRKWMDALHAQWGETWVPRVCLADRVTDASDRAVALAEEQIRILDIASDNSRAIVTGGAGTGKTVVARELCLRKATSGKRVQYFCFTDALAMSVDRQFESARAAGSDVRSTPIRRYAAALLKASGRAASEASPDFWANVSFEAACSALPPLDERPDLVVIDEAQDLDDSDKALIEELSGDNDLWIFRDPKQQFWRDRGIAKDFDSDFAKLKLQTQHRNPSAIAKLVSAYAPESSELELKPDPSIRIVSCEPGSLPRRLAHKLSTLRKEGAAPRDIAIVTLAGQTLSEVLKQKKLGSHRLVSATDADGPNQIVADTFLRFKGLERPFVIVCELDAASSRSYRCRMHIATSRAAVQLIVMVDENTLKSDSHLQSLHTSSS